MSLLPISQSDLELCAQRWGWEYLEPRYSSPRIEAVVNGNLVRLLPDRNDWTNAAAILDREQVLLSRGDGIDINGVSNRSFVNYFPGPNEVDGKQKFFFVNFTTEQRKTPNFRSWLLVQLTLALPPEVWK